MSINELRDKHGRHIHKLRISLLDACNMRCLYCMPEKQVFMPNKDWPKADELIYMATNLVKQGIDEIRLTGGEPLLRADFMEIVHGLDKLPLKKFGFTTNAIHLKKHLKELKKTNCQYINISLDSVNRENFHKITKTDSLEVVLEAILMAKELGFKVKLNTVLLRGMNDHEIIDLIDFAEDNDIEIRFLELMKIGVVLPVFDKLFISAEEVINKVKTKWSLESVEMPVDSTSFNFKTNSGGNIGFIASESRPFCGGCSRLRLGADGKLRPCLMLDDGPSLRGLEPDQFYPFLLKVMDLKPHTRINELIQPMHQVGG